MPKSTCCISNIRYLKWFHKNVIAYGENGYFIFPEESVRFFFMLCYFTSTIFLSWYFIYYYHDKYNKTLFYRFFFNLLKFNSFQIPFNKVSKSRNICAVDREGSLTESSVQKRVQRSKKGTFESNLFVVRPSY